MCIRFNLKQALNIQGTSSQSHGFLLKKALRRARPKVWRFRPNGAHREQQFTKGRSPKGDRCTHTSISVKMSRYCCSRQASCVGMMCARATSGSMSEGLSSSHAFRAPTTPRSLSMICTGDFELFYGGLPSSTARRKRALRPL